MTKRKNELDKKRVAIALALVMTAVTVVGVHTLALPAMNQSSQPDPVNQQDTVYPYYQPYGACCTQLIVNAGSGGGHGFF